MAGSARGQIWRYSPQYRRPRHFHAEPELNLVTGGTGTFGAGAAAFSVTAGDLLWWLPGEDHELVDASPDFDLFVIGMTPELSERALGKGAPFALGGPRKARLPMAAVGRLRALCGAQPGGDMTVVERHVADWWREAHALRRDADKHALTRRALRSLLERPDLGRADVAGRIGACPTEVSRHFHENVGVTFGAFRARQRLLRFIGAVDAGATLLAAALDAGFGSYSQCHRVFCRALGCAPRVFFRASVRGPMADAFRPLSP